MLAPCSQPTHEPARSPASCAASKAIQRTCARSPRASTATAASTTAKTVAGAYRRRRSVFDAFNLCVANHEAGEPGSESASTVEWHIVDPPYEGAYQWMPSTWDVAGGGRYRSVGSGRREASHVLFF